jgi:hypothetical protein
MRKTAVSIFSACSSRYGAIFFYPFSGNDSFVNFLSFLPHISSQGTVDFRDKKSYIKSV